MTARIANGNRTHTSMTITPKALALAGALAVAAILAAGCGSSSTKTVTVTRTVAANTTATTTSAATTTSHARTSTSTSSTTTTAAATTGASATTTATSTTAGAPVTSTTTTRTETGPAFVVTNPTASGALAAAIAVLARKGYSALDTSTYRPGDTLRVLIGRAAGGERAFFFDESTYLGTDATAPSARISVFAQSDTEVVLSYAIYRPGAQTQSGVRLVHFALDMGMLNAVDSIPSVSQRR